MLVHACVLFCVWTEATGLLSGLQSCNGARDTVFIYPIPAVTVVSGVCSLNSGLWDPWRTVKYTNPSKNVTAQNTP